MSGETEALGRMIDGMLPLAVAVSGGVDSMTLAAFAHRRAPGRVAAIHAVSPAVPEAATRRVRDLAVAEGWTLTVTGAGEFEDARYRDNPADRCYFCKTNLYARIRALTPDRIASGANLDDLDDYRPGLIAARERDVVHPFVAAKMTKAMVRALARSLGLGDIAELAAQPCLSSRVETGIRIDADDLAFVERVEMRLAALARGATLRCRITKAGVAVELGPDAHAARAAIDELASALCRAAGRHFLGLRDYRQGAMFVLR
jgi:uncharacterized protein